MRVSSLVSLLASGAVAAKECHPEGPLVPRPADLVHSKSFHGSLANLTKALDDAVSGKINAGWDTQNVSMSLGVVSLDQQGPGVPLWEYHHLASRNVNGTKAVDRNSQYLIGSVSKVISDMALFRSGINVDDPITKYIPSLKNSSSLTSWENITLRGLAEHHSGMVPNYGFSEYYYIKEVFEQLGFPHLNDSAYAPCGIIGLNEGCNKEQFLEGMLSIYPVAAPMTRPVYSSSAFTLFVYALQAYTGKNYTEQVRDFVATPLNMSSTFPSPGDDKLAVIPTIDNSWGSDYGDNAPGGGLVSTLADMSTLVHSILSGTALNSLTEVRQWLQPRTFSGPNSFVGAPWEIFRPPPEVVFPAEENNGSTAAHTVSIYTKDGGAYGYHTRVSAIDEYGVGLVVLTAGGIESANLLHDALVGTVIPAADRAAKEQTAERGYVGTFVGTSSKDTGAVPVNATTVLDGASLRLEGVFRNGTDMRDAIQTIWSATVGEFLPATHQREWRIHPAGVEPTPAELPGSGRKVLLEAWRVWPDVAPSSDTDLPGAGITNHDCFSWTVPDWIYYGGEPIDRLVFVKDAATGEVVGFDAPFLRTGIMDRVKLL